MANPEYEEQRYVMLGDDSGHHYFIKVEDVDAFDKWVFATENDTDYTGPTFDENRINGHLTFTDPRCD